MWSSWVPFGCLFGRPFLIIFERETGAKNECKKKPDYHRTGSAIDWIAVKNVNHAYRNDNAFVLWPARFARGVGTHTWGPTERRAPREHRRDPESTGETQKAPRATRAPESTKEHQGAPREHQRHEIVHNLFRFCPDPVQIL